MAHNSLLELAQGQPGVLPLDAPAAPVIGAPALPDVGQTPSAFRDFAKRIGARDRSLLGVLSSLFGRGTEEIAARKRRDLEQQIFERQAQATLTAKPERKILEDVSGRQRFLDTKELVFPEAQAPIKKPSSVKERISLMIEQGVPRKTATGIATGQLAISRDPISGVAQVIDKATGKRVDAPEPAIEAAVEIEAPLEARVTEELQPDITEALGGTGFVQSSINKIVDLFGGQLPFEQTSDAAAQLQNLNLNTIQLAGSGLGGRPNVFFQERVAELLVEPGSLFSGVGESINRFEALANTFSQEAARIQNDIDTQSLRPATVSEARVRISELQSLSDQYRSVIQSAQPTDLPPLESFFR